MGEWLLGALARILARPVLRRLDQIELRLRVVETDLRTVQARLEPSTWRPWPPQDHPGLAKAEPKGSA